MAVKKKKAQETWERKMEAAMGEYGYGPRVKEAAQHAQKAGMAITRAEKHGGAWSLSSARLGASDVPSVSEGTAFYPPLRKEPLVKGTKRPMRRGGK